MFFIGCDPAPTTCAEIVIQESFVIDLTKQQATKEGTGTYKIVYSCCFNLTAPQKPDMPEVVQIVANLVQNLSAIENSYQLGAAFVGNQGIKHGYNVLPINVLKTIVYKQVFIRFLLH